MDHDTITIARSEAYDLYSDLVHLERYLELSITGDQNSLAERLLKAHIASVKARRLALLEKLEGES